MLCVRLKKFLCCIKLDTGGSIIGWWERCSKSNHYSLKHHKLRFSITVSVLMMGYAYLWLPGYLINYTGVSFLSFLGDKKFHSMNFEYRINFISGSSWSLFFLYSFLLLVTSIILLRSTKTRNHSSLVPFMMLMVLGVILSCIQALKSEKLPRKFAILSAVIAAYFFLCICTLHGMFRQERLEKATKIQAQHDAQQQVV